MIRIDSSILDHFTVNYMDLFCIIISHIISLPRFSMPSNISDAEQQRALPRPLALAFFAGPLTSLPSSPECIASTKAITTKRTTSFAASPPSTTRRVCVRATASAPQRRRKRKANVPGKQSSAARRGGRGFLSVLDDMMEKQYGRGKMYYGPSTMRKQEETAKNVHEDIEEEWEDLKPDPVLVAGGTGRTGQWVVLGLLNQGFNVRVLTRRFERAEELFGESGGNVDVFEANLDSPSTGELAEAVRGARAVVFIAGNGTANLFGIPIPGSPPPPSAKNLLDAIVENASDIQRFVMVAQDAYQDTSRSQLTASNIPYVVLKPGKLSDEEGGLKSISVSVASSDDNDNTDTGASITRLDLAQVVCQALVHDRSIRKLAENDPDNEGDFQFPSTTIAVSNGDAPFDETDATFWTNTFSNL